MKWYKSKALLSLSAEFTFTVLPIIILFIINYSMKDGDIISIKDFLFVSIILYGQSIVKFSSGVSNLPKKTTWQAVALAITFVISLGLVPSCILLSSFYNKTYTSITYIISYLVILLSIFSFYFIGFAGQYWLEQSNKDDNQKII